MPYADTLKVYSKLRESFEEKEVKTIASAMESAFESNNEVLLQKIATKEDIANIHKEIANIHREIANLRAEMYKAMIIQAGVIIGAVVALIRFLP